MELGRTHAKTQRIEACGGGDGGGGESTCSGAGEGDVADADEAMVVCTVVDSAGRSQGGAIYKRNGDMTLESCTFTSNEAVRLSGCVCRAVIAVMLNT